MTECYKNLSDLIERLKEDEQNSNEVFYYRGQNHNWPIKSTLSRFNYSDEEIERTKSFVNRIKSVTSLSKMSDGECLAIAQHYGYKTDLIDFTTSIDVAAFFATYVASNDDTSNDDTSNDDTSNDSEDKHGYIWRISSSDIEIMKLIAEAVIKQNAECKIYTENDEREFTRMKNEKLGPFISYEIPGLSRMNNQKGVFLWDLHEIFTEHFLKDRSADFKFEHDGTVYSEDCIKNIIFPEPNALEHQIMCFKSGETKDAFLKIKDELIQNTLTLETPDSIAEKYLTNNEWEFDCDSTNKRFQQEKKYETHKKVDLINEQEVIINIIKKNRDNIESGEKILIDYENEKLAQKINEAINTLIYFPYSNKEIRSIINKIILLYNKIENNIENEEMIEIEMEDSAGTTSYSQIPYRIIDIKMNTIKKEIKKTNKNIPSDLNELLKSGSLSLLIDLRKFPKKVFSQKEINDIFVNYVVPYQFICRPEGHRIYSPSNLEIFGLS